MLKLRILADDMRHPWKWTTGRWLSGSSWVEPFCHPMTAQHFLTDGRRTALINTACTVGSPEGLTRVHAANAALYDEAVGTVLDHNDDWVMVETCTDGRVRVLTGTSGTAPVYLTARPDALYGSWDLLELRRHSVSLDVVEVARRISLSARYTNATFWSDVHLLTERACVLYTQGKVSLHLPEPAEHSRARILRDGRCPVDAFDQLLSGTIRRSPWKAGSTAVQLSGGIDSTNTALALGNDERGSGLVAAALILDGERGTQQTRRRRTVIGHIDRDWADVTVRAEDHLPYAPGSIFAQQVPVSPYGDLYLDAVDALHTQLEQRGVEAVFTGIGGDELMAFTSAEAPQRSVPLSQLPAWIGPAAREALRDVDAGITPASVVPETALMAKAGVAPPLLKRGMWPVHPLTAPALVRLCEWAPVDWREDKRLLRTRIDRRGMAPEIARPPIPENFGTIMALAMSQHGAGRVRRLLDEGSPLLDARLLDPQALRAVADRLDSGEAQRADREVVFALLADSAVTMR
ncbi:asparagine synthase-related protein [Kitasatospora sp. NPDC058184]|uniref:asparagine synthase-related protein n=1 Tax=unclassified Kitasatospora TaxID=2633591 RepID=UPI0036B8F167